jgi:hypothetical protein
MAALVRVEFFSETWQGRLRHGIRSQDRRASTARAGGTRTRNAPGGPSDQSPILAAAQSGGKSAILEKNHVRGVTSPPKYRTRPRAGGKKRRKARTRQAGRSPRLVDSSQPGPPRKSPPHRLPTDERIRSGCAGIAPSAGGCQAGEGVGGNGCPSSFPGPAESKSHATVWPGDSPLSDLSPLRPRWAPPPPRPGSCRPKASGAGRRVR